jgi:hypothetical protein
MHTYKSNLKDFVRTRILLTSCVFLLLLSSIYTPFSVASAQSSNTCAPIENYLNDMLASLPDTGVCNNAYTENYVCRDFARDECNALRRAKRKAWKLVFGYDKTRPNGTRGFPSQFSPLIRCILKVCGIDQSICYNHNVYNADNKQLSDCVDEKISPAFAGHAVVTTEITDATAARLGLHVFAVYEPQRTWSDPEKILCVWKQKSTYPVLPHDCKNKIREAKMQSGNLEACTDLSLNFRHYECNEPVPGDPSPSPTPTLIKPPRGW